MKRLLKHLKAYKKEAILGPLFKFLEAIFELLVPLVLANIINIGIKEDRGLSYIIPMVLLMIALGLVGLICSVTAQYFSAKAATGFAYNVREEVFDKIQSLSFSEIDKLGTATLINQLNSDVNQLQNGVNMFLRLFLRSPFVVVGAVVMAFIVNAKAGLVFLALVPVLGFIIFFVLNHTKTGYKDIQKHLDKVTLKTKENLQGARVIRAFTMEDDENNDFNDTLNNLYNKQKKVSILSTLLNPLSYALINVGIVLVVYIGAKQVESGFILQGDVLALYNYMTQILVELVKFANLVILLSKSLACANRISNTLSLESSLVMAEEKEVNFKDDITIKFDHVYFKYQGQQGYTLKNINFECKSGESIGIIGGTGSGKTSLINLLGHFYDVSKGKILINNEDIASIPLEALRNNVSYVMQKAVLFKGTIRDNLRWRKANAKDEELYDALECAQCRDILLSHPDGLDSEVAQNGTNFSGGQRQRLSIARALVGSPKVLILDDSASALDYITDLNLRKAIKNIPNPPITFIVSQRTSAVMNADKIIVLDNGNMVGIGTHDELLKNSLIYKEIYDSQFKKGEE